MGAFCCHGNQSFNPIFPKTLCTLSPTPVMLHIKFDQDWPTGFRDIQVWKCGRRTTEDDGRRTTDDGRRTTDDGPLIYYKLTLWAFGSGELKSRAPEAPHCTWTYFLSGWPVVFILPPETDNCPTWISGTERMAVEFISWPNICEKYVTGPRIKPVT